VRPWVQFSAQKRKRKKAHTHTHTHKITKKANMLNAKSFRMQEEWFIVENL
jgi:hypothetical protein